MNRYTLSFSTKFERDLKSYRKDKLALEKIKNTLKILASDPFYPGLKTHSVNIQSVGDVYSSRVTGDIRIIWIFKDKKGFTIITLRVGGHDTVYS